MNSVLHFPQSGSAKRPRPLGASMPAPISPPAASPLSGLSCCTPRNLAGKLNRSPARSSPLAYLPTIGFGEEDRNSARPPTHPPAAEPPWPHGIMRKFWASRLLSPLAPGTTCWRIKPRDVEQQRSARRRPFSSATLALFWQWRGGEKNGGEGRGIEGGLGIQGFSVLAPSDDMHDETTWWDGLTPVAGSVPPLSGAETAPVGKEDLV
jgi:hypothetical protein